MQKTYNKSRSAQSQDRSALPFLGLAGPRPVAPRGLESQPRPAPPPETSGPCLGLPEADPRPGHTSLDHIKCPKTDISSIYVACYTISLKYIEISQLDACLDSQCSSSVQALFAQSGVHHGSTVHQAEIQ
jgi:hypothetical protein